MNFTKSRYLLFLVYLCLSGCQGANVSHIANDRWAVPGELQLKFIDTKAHAELVLVVGEKVQVANELNPQTSKYGPRGATTSRYILRDINNQKILAEAESAISDVDFYKGRFRGERRIETSPDGRCILIAEDVSDASPSVRYILFEKNASGVFEVFYLAPKYQPLNYGDEFNHAMPNVDLSEKSLEEIPRFKTPFNRG